MQTFSISKQLTRNAQALADAARLPEADRETVRKAIEGGYNGSRIAYYLGALVHPESRDFLRGWIASEYRREEYLAGMA